MFFSETKNNWERPWRREKGMGLIFGKDDNKTIGGKTGACISVTHKTQEGADP